MKILTLRIYDDGLAEYLAQLAANSHLTANKTIEFILRASRNNGWTEVSMVPVIRRPADE